MSVFISKHFDDEQNLISIPNSANHEILKFFK